MNGIIRVTRRNLSKERMKAYFMTAKRHCDNLKDDITRDHIICDNNALSVVPKLAELTQSRQRNAFEPSRSVQSHHTRKMIL